MLAKYTERAKKMTAAELDYALRDITMTIKLHEYGTEYSNKLYAEFDAYTVEVSQRRRKETKRGKRDSKVKE